MAKCTGARFQVLKVVVQTGVHRVVWAGETRRSRPEARWRPAQVMSIIVLVLLVLPLLAIAFPVFPVSAVGSWNSNISCTPTTVRISDITHNQTGTTSFNRSPWSPGITTTVSGGVAKRWLTPGSTPSGWHSPGPSCSFFVEIDGVKRASTTSEDSSSSYDATNGGGSYGKGSINDFTFNVFDPKVVSGNSCTSASDLTCYGK